MWNLFVGDRSKIKVQGKRKLGARQLHPETVVCKVKLEGEEELRNVRAGITGYLIEINELIKKNPNLLKTDPKCDGFLAIVMPKGPLRDTEILVNNNHLIKEEKYFELLQNLELNKWLNIGNKYCFVFYFSSTRQIFLRKEGTNRNASSVGLLWSQ